MIERDGTSVYGQVSSGYLRLRCRCRQVVLTSAYQDPPAFQEEGLFGLWIELEHQNQPLGRALLDIETVPEDDSLVDCMFLKPHINFNDLHVLLLQKVPTSEYQRMGFGRIEEDCDFFSACPEQLITII